MREQLPITWTYARLDQVAAVVAGNPAPQGSEYFANGEFNFVRVYDMGMNGDTSFLTKTRDLINAAAAKKMRLIPSNSILFTKSGASTLLNQRAILAKDSYVVSHIAAALPSKGVESKWLFYFLQLIDFATLAHATNMPSLPLSRAKAIRVPIAPTNEQTRIIASVEELLSKLEKGVESFKAAQEQLIVYRQAVLKHAFEGKLTEEWRKKHVDELQPAEALLEKIKATREQRYRQQLDDWKRSVKAWETSGKEGKKPTKPGKPKELPPLTEEELSELPELPERWGWDKAGCLFESVTSGSRGWAKHYSDKGAAFIRITNLGFDSLKLDLSEEKIQHVDPPNNAEGLRTRVQEGDFLFSITGYLGMFAIAPKIDKAYVNQHIALAKPLSGFCKDYLGYYITAKTGGHHHLNRLTKGAVKAGLGLDDIRSFPFPMCSQEEQKKIVSKIESRLSVVESLEHDIANGLKQAEALRQSLLKKAFEGKLVPQDPNDEPASVLLERIKKEKAELKKNARKEKKVAV